LGTVVAVMAVGVVVVVVAVTAVVVVVVVVAVTAVVVVVLLFTSHFFEHVWGEVHPEVTEAAEVTHPMPVCGSSTKQGA
jgi:hypothetical protein